LERAGEKRDYSANLKVNCSFGAAANDDFVTLKALLSNSGNRAVDYIYLDIFTDGLKKARIENKMLIPRTEDGGPEVEYLTFIQDIVLAQRVEAASCNLVGFDFKSELIP
jgi:hypothetical protein